MSHWKLWVVELWAESVGRWEVTVGVALTRSEARTVLADWVKNNPNTRFRVRSYAREYDE